MMGRQAKLSAAVLGAIALTLAVAVATFDWNWLKPYAEQHLSESSGRRVALVGDVAVALSLTPRVHLEQVRIANPPWAHEAQMLEADAVDLTIDLRRLWAGEHYFPEVTLTRPKLALEVSPDGRRNWYLDREQKDERAALRVGRLQVDAGTVVFHDPAQRTELHAALSSASDNDGQANLVFAASGRWRGQPLQASGSGGPVMSLRDDSVPYPIKFRANVGGTEADVDGSVTGLTALRAADLKLALRGRNFAALYPLLRVALPPTPPYRIAGRLLQNGQRLRYEQFRGRVGSSDIAGNIGLDLSAAKPAVKADIVSNTLDLADLGPLIGVPAMAAPASAKQRLLPDEAFKRDRWQSIDMDVRFAGRHLLHAARLPLDDFAMHAVLKDGVLRLDPLAFGVGGSAFSSQVTLDGRGEQLQGKLGMQVRQLRLNRVAPAINLPDAKIGDIGADVELAGRGNSVARLLANADGHVRLAVNDGEVSKLMLKLLGLDLGGYLWTRLTGDRDVPIRCAVANFDARHGVLEANTLVFDTSDTIVLGVGKINLADETLALTIHPQPKQPSILSLRTPLHLGGSFRQPQLKLDQATLAARGGAALGLAILNPLAALLPLIETGPGQDSDCTQLMASLRRQATRPPAKRQRMPA
jgi:AsmA protein